MTASLGSQTHRTCLPTVLPTACFCNSLPTRKPIRRRAVQASAICPGNLPSCRSVAGCGLISPAVRRVQQGHGLHAALSRRLTGRRLQPSVTVRTRNGLRMQITAAAVAEAEAHHPDIQTLLDTELPPHPDLTIGHLENGLRYVILPNKSPPDRMEVHMEVHAGSVDEGPEEQGVAHFVEHVTFLGSRKRENLLGTGCRSNAYTDFQHTVFHVHMPLANGNTGRPMLPQVLDALREVAFEAEFLDSRIEKERRAVLSEAGMMNSIEYRVDCQLLGWLHAENALGHRFPIGKTDQVGRWNGDVLRSFWRRWYYPANCTLYVVGDLDRSIPEIEGLVRSTFDRVAPGRELNGNQFNGSQHNGASSIPVPSQSIQLGPLKPRQLVRPPVIHDFGFLVNGAVPQPAPIQIFQHRLLQQYCLSIFCKLPIAPIQRLSGLRRGLLVRMLISVLTFRVNSRYSEPGSRFLGIELDISDSAREGCMVSTLTITSEAGDWRASTQVAIQEVRRLQKYGFTASELDRYLTALLRDSAQLALSSDAISHQQNLEFAMDSIALDHTFTHPSESYDQLSQAALGVTLEEVNGLCRSLLSFASHYGREDELAEEARQQPEMWTQGPPTRATSIVACVPMHVDASGQSIGAARPIQRGSSMAMTEHVDDPAAAAAALAPGDPLDRAVPDDDEVPEGAVVFKVSESDIANVLSEQSLDIEAKQEVETPEFLMQPEQVQQLMAEHRPHYVPVSPGGSSMPAADPATGIVQRRLSNGVALNARTSDVEPQAALLRLSCVGGRISEPSTPGPSGQGAIMVGTRAVSESGAVGSWRREQLELFCISRLINCAVEATEEQVTMDFSFPVGDNGLKAVLELLHLFVTEPCWTEGALYRAKQAFRSHYLSLPKSLERSTADRILTSMLGPDRRFRDSTLEDLDALTLDGMRSALRRLLHPENIEVSVVGDIDLAELDALAPMYLGTIRAEGPLPDLSPAPLHIQRPAPSDRSQAWHLKDSDERAFAYIAGPVPSEWAYRELQGPAAPGSVVTPRVLPRNASPEQVQQALAEKQRHPLFTGVVLALLVEVMNGRLFTTVRDALGLTYDVSFELALFELLKNGWFSVSVTSSPEKIHETAEACVRVLRAPGHSPITQRELERARRTLITRHETDSKENAHWLGLMTRTQCPYTPWRTLESIRDIRPMYEAIDLQDMQSAYNQFQMGDDSIFVCIGTSGKAPPQAPSPPITNGLGNGYLPLNLTAELQAELAAVASARADTAQQPGPAEQQQVKDMAQVAALAAAASLAKNFDFGKAFQRMQQEMKDKKDKPK